jgi:hypothetical protein
MEPGSAPERTRLAWTRTLLAGTVVAVLAVRLALHTGLTGWRATGAACAALGWLLLVALVRSRLRTLGGRPREACGSARQAQPVARREPGLLALTVLGYAVLGIALAVLP